MNCPKDNQPMEKVRYQGVEVDRCVRCKGLWFDVGEKERLKLRKGSESVDSGDARFGKIRNEVERIYCPRCKNPMDRLSDPEQPHVWYEGCPTCYGVYFDAGEFKDFKEESVLDIVKSWMTRERR